MIDERRFLELIEFYLDNDLSAADETELVSVVERSPAHLQQLRSILRDQNICRTALRGFTASDIAQRVSHLVQGWRPASAASAVSTVVAHAVSRRQTTARLYWIRMAAAALIVLVTAPMLWWFIRGQPADNDATAPRVVAVTGRALTERGTLIALGDHLRIGGIARTDAGAQVALVWPDGTQVDLAGGTTLAREAGTGEHLRLDLGSISVVAAKRPAEEALEVHCADATVRVVGTRFAVAFADGKSTVSVSEGLVRVQRRSDGKSSVLGAGQQVTVNLLPPPAPMLYSAERIEAVRQAVDAGRHPWVDSMASLRSQIGDLLAPRLPDAGDLLVPAASGPQLDRHLQARAEIDQLCRSMIGLSLWGRLQMDDPAATAALERIRRATDLRLIGDEADLLVSDMLVVHVLQSADLLRSTRWWSDQDSARIDRWITEVAFPAATRLEDRRRPSPQRSRGLAALMAIEAWRGNLPQVRARMSQLRSELPRLLPAVSNARMAAAEETDNGLFQNMIHVLLAVDIARAAGGEVGAAPAEWDAAVQAFVRRVTRLKLQATHAESALSSALFGNQPWRTTQIPSAALFPDTHTNSYCWYFPNLQARDPRLEQ